MLTVPHFPYDRREWGHYDPWSKIPENGRLVASEKP